MAKSKFKEEPKSPFEPWDGEYIGNIWGWKFSFIALAIMILLGAFMAYRFHSLGVSPFDNQPVKQEIPVNNDAG